jgi:Yip1-like protein
VTGLFTTGQNFDLRKMGSRMLMAARLDRETSMELRDDSSATAQSLSLVILVALCYGIGFSLFGLFNGAILDLEVVGIITLASVLAGVAIAFVWSGTTFLIGTKLFHKKISYWGLARPFFFSWSPGLLFIITSAPIPVISEIILAVATAWIGIASVFAVKNAMGISSQQSMLVFITSVLSLGFIGTLVLSLIQSLV